MRIGALAAQTGLSTKTIRFYEQIGLLPDPPRTSAGYRDHPEETAARLAFIRDSAAAGLTLAQIRDILTIRDSGQPPCAHVAEVIDAHLNQVEARLIELTQARTVLAALRRRAAATDPVECTGADICTILARHDESEP